MSDFLFSFPCPPLPFWFRASMQYLVWTVNKTDLELLKIGESDTAQAPLSVTGMALQILQ